MVCSPTGEFLYPAAWQQCSARVWCPDPGNSSTVSRVYRDWAGTGDWRAVRQFHNLEYASVLEYTCDDNRQVSKDSDIQTTSCMSITVNSGSSMLTKMTAICQQ